MLRWSITLLLLVFATVIGFSQSKLDSTSRAWVEGKIKTLTDYDQQLATERVRVQGMITAYRSMLADSTADKKRGKK